MIKVEIVNDEHQEGVRWLKASHNGVAWSLIEFRNNEEALQIISALQQSIQADKAMSHNHVFIGGKCKCGMDVSECPPCR